MAFLPDTNIFIFLKDVERDGVNAIKEQMIKRADEGLETTDANNVVKIRVLLM